jgi:serine/threonine-protein kinase RsbW
MAALAGIFPFLEQELASHHASSATIFAVSLAVEELFTNMVKYSSPGAGTVSISVAAAAGSCRIVMEECGVEPFDPTGAAEIDLARHLESGRAGGFGLYLVRHLVDDVRFEYRDGCNVITVSKELES